MSIKPDNIGNVRNAVKKMAATIGTRSPNAISLIVISGDEVTSLSVPDFENADKLLS